MESPARLLLYPGLRRPDETLAACGRCLGYLEACRLQTQQDGFVVRRAECAAGQGGKGSPGTQLGPAGFQVPH